MDVRWKEEDVIRLSTQARPRGVKLLAALWILLGTLSLFGGFALTIAGFRLPQFFPGQALAVRSVFLGAVLIGFALTSFGLAYGSWKGKAWTWTASLAFALMGIVFSVFSLFVRPGVGELAALIVYLLIVYYLMQPRVQSFFGKGAGASAS